MNERGRTIFDVASIAILLAIGAWLIQRGWGDWADPIYNTGRELHIAQQVAQGRVLYRDIAHLNGPISQQCNAQLFRTFGPRVGVLTIANLVLLGVLVAMTWWLLRQIADQIAATVGCVVLLILFALAPGSNSFNFALPYEHEATHGLIGATAALCGLAMYLRTHRARWLVVTGCLLGIVLLTKFGIFVSATLPIVVGVLASCYARRADGREWKQHLAAVAGPIVVIGFIAFSMMLDDLSAKQALGAVFGSGRWIANPKLLAMPWYRQWLGIERVGRSLDEILVCALAYVVLFGPPIVAGVVARRRGEWRVAATIGSALFVLGALFTLYDAISWPYAFRGLNVLALALAIALGATLLHRNRRDIDPDLILRLSVVWFALFMILHLGLRAVISDYGFIFALPATMVMLAAGISWVPAMVDRGGGFGWAPRAAMLAAVAVIVTVYIQRDDRQLARSRAKTTLGDGIDALKFDDRGQVMLRMLAELRSRAEPGQTLVVAPDGAMLNYLSGLPNPTPYFGLMPPEVAMFGGQQRVRDAVVNSPPDWFVLTSGEAESFGFKSFAIDYGAEIWSCIEQRYTPVARFGSDKFEMQLYRRTQSQGHE